MICHDQKVKPFYAVDRTGTVGKYCSSTAAAVLPKLCLHKFSLQASGKQQSGYDVLQWDSCRALSLLDTQTN